MNKFTSQTATRINLLFKNRLNSHFSQVRKFFTIFVTCVSMVLSLVPPIELHAATKTETHEGLTVSTNNGHFTYKSEADLSDSNYYEITTGGTYTISGSTKKAGILIRATGHDVTLNLINVTIDHNGLTSDFAVLSTTLYAEVRHLTINYSGTNTITAGNADFYEYDQSEVQGESNGMWLTSSLPALEISETTTTRIIGQDSVSTLNLSSSSYSGASPLYIYNSTNKLENLSFENGTINIASNVTQKSNISGLELSGKQEKNIHINSNIHISTPVGINLSDGECTFDIKKPMDIKSNLRTTASYKGDCCIQYGKNKDEAITARSLDEVDFGKNSYIKIGCHNWDDGKIIKASTQTENGKKQYTCKNCNITKTETLLKLGQQQLDGKIYTSYGELKCFVRNIDTVFPEGVELRVSEMSDNDIKQADPGAEDIEYAKYLDIKLIDKDGNVISEPGNVEVWIEIPPGWDTNDIRVLRVVVGKDILLEPTIDGDYFMFVTNHFSPYMIYDKLTDEDKIDSATNTGQSVKTLYIALIVGIVSLVGALFFILKGKKKK